MDFAETAYADGFAEVDVAGDGGGADVVPVLFEGLEYREEDEGSRYIWIVGEGWMTVGRGGGEKGDVPICGLGREFC